MPQAGGCRTLDYMGLPEYFQMLARYNRIANEKLYGRCADLVASEYRKQRRGSFGSIHALLNHILLGDRIWMARFEGQGNATPALDAILFDNFHTLWAARVAEDARIQTYFEGVDEVFLARQFSYTNSLGREYVEEAPVAIGHFFNHQTHHRGQVHVMLSQTEVPPPALDLHRIVNP